MSEHYKDFPPGWGHLKIPTNSKQAALAGLALYSPCKRKGFLAQRLAWEFTRLVGPKFLPWTRERWSPPIGGDTWSRLKNDWRQKIGEFDTHAIYSRHQSDRAGLILLLIKRGEPVAFLKLDQGDDSRLRNEFDATTAVAAFQPTSFHVPQPLGKGVVDDWHYIAFSPLPVSPHRPQRWPPLSLILREVRSALANMPRTESTPDHWEPVHGDFTPWNLRELQDGSLVLIDWEEAGWGPPGSDELLYRSVASHLWRAPLNISERDEAVDYWEGRFRGRLGSHGRDHKMALSVVQSLSAIDETDRADESKTAPWRPRVLVFAYAGEPGKGSEPAAGWGLINALAQVSDCTVLTAPEHMSGLRLWKAENPETDIKFVEVPEARIAAYAKWHRLPWFLLYLNWLGRAYRAGRAFHDAKPFDAVHHATYSTYWLPSPIIRFGIPSLWGPVGGAARTPYRLWPILGMTGLWDEILDRVSVRMASWWPGTRRTWRKVSARIVQNEETLQRLPRSLRHGTSVLNHVLFIQPPEVKPRKRKRHMLYLSALESRKGARLAIKALACTDDVQLIVAGDGPERAAVQRLAKKLKLENRIQFLGRVDRTEAFELLAECAAAVFTGVREEGGIALAEAMSCGAPVIVLANGGARTVASSGTDPRRIVLIQPSTVNETARRMGDAMTRFSRSSPTANEPMVDQAHAYGALQQILRHVVEQSRKQINTHDQKTARSS